MLRFTKMNGAGNDFVMIDARDGSPSLEKEVIAHLCDRHRGIGADGLIAVEPAQGDADFRMRYYNSDGGEAEMCGNGARCFARYASRLSGQSSGTLRFETQAGVIAARFTGKEGELVRLDMSEPRDLALRLPVPITGESLVAHFVNTGVPHAVVFVKNLEEVPVRDHGSQIRHHELFAPRGTNVNFAQEQSADTIAIRTYERGVEDETLACGTGVVASALIFHELTGAQGPIKVIVRGGDTLEVSFYKEGDHFRQVTLTGPADFVFEGEIALPSHG